MCFVQSTHQPQERVFHFLTAMSSLRNAVKRITHKERAQPRARSHLGILEKKKDYVKRAKDFHRREDIINKLKEKASMRNPDEFYFGMHKTEVRNGKHSATTKAKQEEFDEKVGEETIRIMKDQDLSYVRMQQAKDKTKIERMRASLHMGDPNQPVGRKHTIFVDSQEEAQNFDAATHFNTLPELVGRSHNRSTVDQVKQMAEESIGIYKPENSDDEVDFEPRKPPTEEELKIEARKARKMARKLSRARSAAYNEIDERSKRIKSMEKAEAHLVMGKLLSGKGAKRKIKAAEDGKPAQYVWKTKRQK